MPWIHLLLAVAAFAVALGATSIALAMACLLAALVFIVLGIMGLLARRVDADARPRLDARALQRLREQADVRNATRPGA